MNIGTRIRVKSITCVAKDWIGYHGILISIGFEYSVIRLIYRNSHLSLTHGTINVENDALEKV